MTAISTLQRFSHTLTRSYSSHCYTILFYSLLLTLFAPALLRALQIEAALLTEFLAFNLVIGALGLEHRSMRSVMLVLIVLAVTIGLLDIRPVSQAGSTVPFLWTLLGLFSAAMALRFALRAKSVRAEHIYAALSAYLLVGLFFGILYAAIESVWPESFTVTAAAGTLPLEDAIYFSFVTLATLGYGDMLPVSEVARGFAVVEAIAGQLFLAVLIARLISSTRNNAA